jgi:hypothetical protein
VGSWGLKWEIGAFMIFLRNHKLPRYLLRLGIGGFLILFALEYRQVGNWGLLMIFGGIIFYVLGIGDFNTFGFGVSTSGQLGT